MTLIEILMRVRLQTTQMFILKAQIHKQILQSEQSYLMKLQAQLMIILIVGQM